MVRTYVFSGCFTRPPGTSTRNHPHEPTASKPVVPRVSYTAECSAASHLTSFVAVLAPQTPHNESDANPRRLRNPLGVARRRLQLGGTASHLGGLALCDSV